MKTAVIYFFTGCLVGAAGLWAYQQFGIGKIKYPVQAKLYRMSIHPEKMKTYQDWVDWHTREKDAINATMEREKMYVEAVFRDTLHEPDVIYWLAVSGEGGKHYDSSPLPADQKHAAYMKQILVKGSGSVLKTEFLMLPPFEEKSIITHQQQEK